MSLLTEPVDIPLLVELSKHETQPAWADLAKALERDSSNVRRSVLRLTARGVLTVKPWGLSAEARALAGAVRGTGSADAPQDSERQTTPLNLIAPSPLNPRKHFDPEALTTLAASIKAKGLLAPIVVRPAPDQSFQIIAGERRWRALRLLAEAGEVAPDAPVATVVRPCTDIELIELAIAENRDREDVHPLEEAQAYAAIKRLRAEAGEDEGRVTAELAERAGVTRRHIQKRIALHERLSPAVTEAFAQNRINLAQASALAPFPHPTQDAGLENIERKYHGWDTAEAITANLRNRFALPASNALFPREAYDGPVDEGEDGELTYLDRAQAEALQRKALEAVAEERRAEGWGEVRVCSAPDAGFFDGYRLLHDDRPKSEAHLFLTLDSSTLALRERAAIIEHKPAPVSAEPGGPDLSYGNRHWAQARADKTVRLQIALTKAPPAYAMAITIIALCRDFMAPRTTDEPRNWIHGYQRSSLDKMPDAAGRALAAAAAPLKGAPGISLDEAGFMVTDPARALPALVTSPALEAVFACAVARQCGAWIGHGPEPGDGPFNVEVARQLAAILPAWEMSEGWLKTFNMAQLAKIADACITPGDPDAGDTGSTGMPAKKGDAIKWILNHVRRDTSWAPPEMAFADGRVVSAGAQALMTGQEGSA